AADLCLPATRAIAPRRRSAFILLELGERDRSILLEPIFLLFLLLLEVLVQVALHVRSREGLVRGEKVALKVFGHLARPAIAVLAVLRQRLQNDALEMRREVLVETRRRNHLDVADFFERRKVGFAEEQAIADDEFVQNRPAGEDIRSVVELDAPH